MNLHDRDIRRIALQEGISQGEHQKAIETAKKLIEYGDSAEKIAFTGFSIKNADVFFHTDSKNLRFFLFCLCEERSDVAIHLSSVHFLDCFGIQKT